MDKEAHSTTQTKRTIEAKSREIAKRVKTYHTADWGDYNVDFLLPGTSGAHDVLRFLKQLDALSVFPNTRPTIIAQLTSDLRTLKSKNELLVEQQSKLEHSAYNPNFPEHDVITITDAPSLEQAIGRPFRMPLLHRATTEHPSLNPYPGFGIKDFLEHLAGDKDATLCVYDYSVSQTRRRTRSTTVSELLECFQSEDGGRPLNFLDIENRTYHQFCPPPIIQHSLMTNLSTRTRDKGKTGSTWDPKPPKEFFLASSKNSISTIHVDTGGQVTWIMILEGRKIWYFPRHSTSQTLRWLELAGPENPKHYEGGWIKVELRRGDLLVMPPSFPHAVFTPENCLAVGGQVYTKGNLAQSIDGLRVQERAGNISNEDLDESVYNTLAKILRECDSITDPVEKAQLLTSCNLFPSAPKTTSTSYDSLSKNKLKSFFKERELGYSFEPEKEVWIKLLKSRDNFLAAADDFNKRSRSHLL